MTTEQKSSTQPTTTDLRARSIREGTRALYALADAWDAFAAEQDALGNWQTAVAYRQCASGVRAVL